MCQTWGNTEKRDSQARATGKISPDCVSPLVHREMLEQAYELNQAAVAAVHVLQSTKSTTNYYVVTTNYHIVCARGADSQ